MIGRNWTNVKNKTGNDIFGMVMDHAAGNIDQGQLIDKIGGHCKASYDEGFVDGGSLASQIGMGGPVLVEFELDDGRPYYVNPLAVVDLMPFEDGDAFTFISIGVNNAMKVAMGIRQVAEALAMPDVVMSGGPIPDIVVDQAGSESDQTVVRLIPKTDVEKCADDLRKLQGLPPYDGSSNIVRGDGIFSRSIDQRYDAETRMQAEQILYLDGVIPCECGSMPGFKNTAGGEWVAECKGKDCTMTTMAMDSKKEAKNEWNNGGVLPF